MAILGTGHLVEVLGAMGRVENLGGIQKQSLHVLPYPLGPITDDTKPPRVLGNQALVFDLLQGFSQIGLTLHLVPAEPMHDALSVQEIAPKAFGLVPRVPPCGPARPIACLAWATSSRIFGSRRHRGAINAEHQHGACKPTSAPPPRRPNPPAATSPPRWSIASRDGATSKTLRPSAT